MSYTNNQFHTSQVLATNEAPRVVRKASMSVFVGAMALYASTLIPSHPLTKITSMAIASSLVYVSHRLDKLENMLSPYEAIAHQQSVAAYGNWLSHSMKPPAREVAIAAPAELPTPVKFADVRQALAKPHVMLLGSTGDGKSTLAKHLAANCTAYTIVIDPHAAPDDWGNLPVYGAGRKYEQIAEIMQVTLQLLQKRFDARDQGVKQFEPIVIICDEYPAIIASSVAGKVASSWMKLISREARKVAIRLVVLTQSPEVKAIGLEGEGSVRDNFCFIKLGEFALDHAKSLKDDAIKLAVESCDRPAMLGNLPCNIPQLSDRVAMPVMSIPADFAELTQVDKLTEIDELTRIDSPIDGLKTLKSDVNPSTVNLSKPAQVILDYARKQDKFVTASQVKAGARLFRDSSVLEIRRYFQWLADENLGVVRGDLENLEFSVS
ncbi:type IV secretory system conjugative DNA transfer family protein [Pseudanabaena minima]|uniref:type IV secretory system conjugative DNA transfer family protein n=1 Tax=Pseudanabaena minima TaxID=890415 RepID=UPI003DA88B2D